MPADTKTPVRILSETGTDMMTLEEFGRDGRRMTVRGAVMGAWPSTMYVEPRDVVKLVGMLLRPRVLGYLVSVPFLLLRRPKEG
jgi:hypothetical protein